MTLFLLGGLLGVLLSVCVRPARAWWAARQVVPPTPLPPAQYVITSGGHVVWSGDDGTEARDRWELTSAGTFHDSGILRGTR